MMGFIPLSGSTLGQELAIAGAKDDSIEVNQDQDSITSGWDMAIDASQASTWSR